MRRISVDKLETGMCVAKNVYGLDGRILLASGLALRPQYIQRLRELEIPAIYVEDERTKGLDIPDVISEQTRLEANMTVKDVMRRVEGGQPLQVDRVKKAVNLIIDELLSTKNILVNLVDIRAHDDYTFGHSVNVSVLAIIVGLQLNYDQSRLRELGVGAILHDLGKRLIDNAIMNKPGSLTPEEFEEIKKHTLLGYQLLRENGEISLLSAHVALQHHEKMDGTGYPRGIKGNEIHEYARIVAICDVFDALTSDRVYRKRYLPYQAIEIISASNGRHFDPRIAKAFLDNVAIYPIGSMVELSTGDIGMVVDINKSKPNRPVCRILVDRNGRILDGVLEVDLTKYKNVHVSRALDDDRVPVIWDK